MGFRIHHRGPIQERKEEAGQRISAQKNKKEKKTKKKTRKAEKKKKRERHVYLLFLFCSWCFFYCTKKKKEKTKKEKKRGPIYLEIKYHGTLRLKIPNSLASKLTKCPYQLNTISRCTALFSTTCSSFYLFFGSRLLVVKKARLVLFPQINDNNAGIFTTSFSHPRKNIRG